MAPVKRVAASAQRETRSTRASAVVKNVTSSTKKTASPIAKKRAATTNILGAVTRRTRNGADEQMREDPSTEDEETKDIENVEAKPLRGRPTKITVTKMTATKPGAVTRSLAAAPRRRIKITPLDIVAEPAVEEEMKSSQNKSKKPTISKKTSTRSQKTMEEAHEDDDQFMEDAPEPKVVKPRNTRKTTTKVQGEQNAEKEVPVKTRGRPKKAESQEQVQAETDEQASAPSTRTIRTRRAGSTVTQQPGTSATAENMSSSRPVTAARKRVTFQGVADENDKENQPLPLKSRKLVTSKSDNLNSTSGLRAKPLRKPVVPSTKAKGRKTALDADKPSGTQIEDQTAEKKKMPRALTPKKITQVAKSNASMEDEAEETYNEEDELSGNKTPVRDLSISPKRPLNAALGRAMSPTKRLEFSQNLGIQTTNREENGEGEGQNGALASPARRLPTSPFKDGLKDSPKRGDGMKLLFPNHTQSQTDVHASLALNPLNIASASQTMSTLLQSPKRNGTVDAGFFSLSAMKKSSTKSPFKTSLLASPARRLFSPAKRPTVSAMSKISELVDEKHQSEPEHDVEETTHDEPDGDITASSRFRASTSPLRIHVLENDHGKIDFDDSALQVRSPLKIQKSPIKKKLQIPLRDAQENDTPLQISNTAVRGGSQEAPKQHTPGSYQIIIPSQLEGMSHHATSQVTDEEGADAVGHGSGRVEITTSSPERSDTVNPGSTISALAPSQNCAKSAQSDRYLDIGQNHFRNINQDDVESSEDELATEQTPVRSIARQRIDSLAKNDRSRLSTGVPQSVAGKSFGFTPLAAQMNGWQAASPQNTPMPRPISVQRQGSFEFSPLAGQHVDGEVMISRDSTPIQKMKLRRSLASVSSTRSVNRSRQSSGLRQSMAQRKSLDHKHHQNFDESPERIAQFEEYMEMRAMEEEADAMQENDEDSDEESHHDLDFDHVMDVGNLDEGSEEGDDTILAADGDPEDVIESTKSGELTTDLINFTNASDTAIVDFQKLAQEAEELAPTTSEVGDHEESSVLSMDNEKNIAEPFVGVHMLPNQELKSSIFGESDQNITAQIPVDMITEEALSPILQATTLDLNSPSFLVIDEGRSEAEDSQSEDEATEDSITIAPALITPARIPLDFSEVRMINTVVSRVPLKPEGTISPIKIQRKRARSFGNIEASSSKRISFGDLKEVVVPSHSTTEQSPDRRMRTSTAPSPGGTSTPASRYGRSSFGGTSANTTPGQMSFAIDDFGDSTLDGIEVPEDYDEDAQMQYDDEETTPPTAERNYDAESLPENSRSTANATPLASKNSRQQAITPATVKKTPVTATRNSSSRKSLGVKSERKPLKPVSTGVLDGAVVFVDVYTSEGADASGIFVELLTQMGARCVKEWRWNPRASLATGPGSDDIEQRVGVTHVVYKDGGKRTLEKVRDAKGEVLCVGVAWVLDCERQNKWLDEANYAIDTTILPRGGSKRRKSMEPRALLHNGDGSLSTSRPRRSVSAEMSEMMKRELINTPARSHHTPSKSTDEDKVNESEDEDEGSPQDQATPTGYISYDPRTAMTPGTPYLVSQGKKLVQMSAPPKQTGKRLFDHDDDVEATEDQTDVFASNSGTGAEGDVIVGARDSNEAIKKDAKKFRMRNLDSKIRRRTLGFKPVVGSPLAN